MTEIYVPREETHFDYYVSVRFEGGSKSYFFGTDIPDLKIGDAVVVDSNSGHDLAYVSQESRSTEDFKSPFPLSPVIRKADADDLRDYALAKEESATALEITRVEVDRLRLPMRLLEARYNLDGSKCTITYTADNRVDFRELLKVLAPKLHCRLDLRQIASRDKAKMVGGIGPCGLTLCCATFLTSFEGISINRAKNQMLSLNIPKLSGVCGKLKCCLAYEDDLYTEEKKLFPRIGSFIKLKEGNFKVDSFNILSRKIHLSSESGHLDLTLDELNVKLNPSLAKPEPKATPSRDESNDPFPSLKPMQNSQNGQSQKNDRKNPKNQNNPAKGQQKQNPQQKKGLNPNNPQKGQQGPQGQNNRPRHKRWNNKNKDANKGARPDDKKGL